MTKHLIFVFIVACLVGSCLPASTISVQAPIPTTSPTHTPFSTPFTTPTVTPYPPLQTQGPYLLFTRDTRTLIVTDADGHGRKQIQLPNSGYVVQLHKSVSPNGEWLAYFTGSAKEPYDIALHILNLSDQTTRHVSNLIAPGFPENLEPVMETMLFFEGDECAQDIKCKMKLLQNFFVAGIYSLAWSPDAHALAFAAQIDGTSSDLYMYDVEAKTVRRITNDPPNVEKINWAPNGKRIMYSNSIPGSLYAGRTIHLADPNNQNIQTPPKLIGEDKLWREHDWLSENLYLLYEPNDTDPPISHINILNTDTGQVKEIWPYTADSYAMDHEAKTIILLHKQHNYLKPVVPAGVYIVDTSGNYKRVIDEQNIFVSFIDDQGPYQVLGVDHEGRVYKIRLDGSRELLAWRGYPFPFISPDGKLLLYPESGKLSLYTDAYQLIKSWELEDGIYHVTWRPDSLGVFIFTDKNAYSLGVSDEQPRPLLDECAPQKCESTRFFWLP